MRRNTFLTFLKEKAFLIVLTLMLVSAGTMAALFAFGTNETVEEEQQAKQVEIQTKTPLAEEAEENTEAAEQETAEKLPKVTVIKRTTDTNENILENTASNAENMENAVMEAELEDQFLEAEVQEELEELAEVSGEDVIAEGFTESALLSLQWPVEGDVILPFSMDRSVYFATLAQYQYNPAMLISASQETEVVTAAAGTVTDVGECNEYGHYVTMDIGDGFMITYGQLNDISTEVGETLEAGERIAMVGCPTGNYLEEGDNLYLKLTQNDVPVDPELYLEK